MDICVCISHHLPFHWTASWKDARLDGAGHEGAGSSWGCCVSLQMAILKVLSCHPGGCATIAALNADLAILNTSGRDWTDRMKRMAACVPALDLFGQQLVVRSNAGWQITDAGRTVLLTAEEQSRTIPDTRSIDPAIPEPAAAVLPADRPRPAIEIVGRRLRRKQRRARSTLSRSA
jgi:hypothetical protein